MNASLCSRWQTSATLPSAALPPLLDDEARAWTVRRRHGLSTLIACVSPRAAAAPETLSTLNFASRARRTVHTHPRLKLVEDESRSKPGARGVPWLSVAAQGVR